MAARSRGRTRPPGGPESGRPAATRSAPTDVPPPSGLVWNPDAPTTSAPTRLGADPRRGQLTELGEAASPDAIRRAERPRASQDDVMARPEVGVWASPVGVENPSTLAELPA